MKQQCPKIWFDQLCNVLLYRKERMEQQCPSVLLSGKNSSVMYYCIGRKGWNNNVLAVL